MGTEDGNRERCLVTGATGFIGRALVPALAEAGYAVTAWSRHSAPTPFPDDVCTRCMDLGNPATDLPLQGVTCIFHLAGIAHQQAASPAYASINVEATERIARAAAEAGVRRFVFFSSVKAAAVLPTANPTPGAAGEGHGMTYAMSKARAEARLEAVCGASGMELVLLRPALVYSSDAPGHLSWLRRWVEARLPRPPAGGARSMIAREDLVRLGVALARAPQVPDVLRITATDGEAYTLRRLHAGLCSALDRTPIVPSPPASIWRLAAGVFDRARGQAPGQTWERLVGTDLVDAVGLEHLGFEAKFSFESSLDAAE